ncbi:zinc finger, CCHC-type containing protein [Tanacetum coccineum]
MLEQIEEVNLQLSNEFTKYCKENGIARQLTAPYSPQQNGVVERRNRTVLSTTRSMMKAMKLPLNFWAEAVRHAIYILNRVPTRALEDKTPYEALYNRKPNLENLRIFGCTAYAKGVLTMKTLHRSTLKSMIILIPYQEQDPINDPNSPITPSPYTYNPHSEEEATTSSARRNQEGNIFDHVPVRGFKDLAEIYQNTQEVETQTLLFTEEEPRNYKEASTDQKWIEAMEIELDSINKNNTWDPYNIATKSEGNRTQMAFLHGELKEEVYVTQPEGFVQQGNSGEVYKPTKALYGLRQDDKSMNKQPTVALSSCESEFMAATAAACQALWLKRLLSELTGWEEERITLKVDNVSAIALVRNPVFHGRSKHIDIRYHFIRECVENGHINVEHVSGELQRADILTKALP